MLYKKTSKIWLVATAILVAMVMPLLALTGTGYAAEPGCYARSGSTHAVADCPAGEPYASGVPAGTCYVAPAGASGIGAFSPADCSTFSVGTQTGSDAAFAPNDCNDSANLTKENCGIIKYLLIFINLLSALVGVVVVGSIIYGGIQYSSAGGDPQKVASAKKRILNALVALIAFIFMYAFLQYIVPGGVF
ncbi:hypothetical protein BH10PAT3_BH10PAT3_5520 [soil metagenome]